MIARCIHTTGRALGTAARGHFYTDQTSFDVTVGVDYEVAGIGLYETVLLALIEDDSGMPNWLPVGLFDIVGEQLPTRWTFAILDGVAASGGDASGRWVAKWGYPELVRDPAHSDALINRDPDALAIFRRREKAGGNGSD